MKKNFNPVFAMLMMLLIAGNVMAGGTKTVEIKTNAVCGECKERIEGALFKVDGVKTAKVNLKTETIKVKFNGAKTSETALRKAVSDVGYDADDVKADASAHAKLPGCCKLDSSKKH